MRFVFRVLVIMCTLNRVISDTSDEVDEDEDSSEETPVTTLDDEDFDLDGGPVTEEVMEPNVTMNEPGEPKVEDETGELEKDDPNWDVNRVIRDLAYYLRAHKFQDYDRRYFKSIDESTFRLYQDFPRPKLRSIHWEVHKHCDSGFRNCLRYVDEIIRMTSLVRTDDTLTIIRENKWDLEKNSQQILATQKDCQMAQRRDNLTVLPFQGPIERFQWRTSVSYYMCWFTMLEKPELEFFGETCSNHANCLDSYGVNNKDPRANDDKPYACALYSFCPDHCCSMKHIWYMRDCFQSRENPCYEENRPADRKCTLKREENRDFESLIRNRINVSCNCRKSGYEWSSKFGICVDVNECTRGSHDCNLEAGQNCINQPGRYACTCKLGLVWRTETGGCVWNPTILDALRSPEDRDDETEPEVKGIFKSIVKTLTRSSAICATGKPVSKFVLLQFIFIYLSVMLEMVKLREIFVIHLARIMIIINALN